MFVLGESIPFVPRRKSHKFGMRMQGVGGQAGRGLDVLCNFRNPTPGMQVPANAFLALFFSKVPEAHGP